MAVSQEPAREVARRQVRFWLNTELHEYADLKWDREDAAHTTWSNESLALFLPQFEEKLHRASVLGAQTPLGKQALLKAMVTAFEMCVTMVVAGEELPKPGVPSGTIA